MKEVFQVLSGAMGQEKLLTQLSNNLANVNTVGFKQERGIFEDVYQEALEHMGIEYQGPLQTEGESLSYPNWPMLINTYTDFTPGGMITTNNTFDVAIKGEGFFQIQVEESDDPFYTRAGNFSLNADYELVTSDGRRVLDDGGKAIQFDATKLGEESPVIREDGTIEHDNGVLAKLGVVRFDDPQQLIKIGEGLYQAPEDVEAIEVEDVRVAQGTVEGANVNMVEEMVRMIHGQRTYEAQQKLIQTVDALAEKRINRSLQS